MQCLANFEDGNNPCTLLDLRGRSIHSPEIGLRARVVPHYHAFLADTEPIITTSTTPIEQTGLSLITERLWLALFRFASRSWWRRTWILQETAVNASEPIIMCGNKTTSWKSVDDFTGLAIGKAALSSTIAARWMHFVTNTRTFVGIRNQFQKNSSLSLDKLLSCGLEATDPRDIVFALLNLATPFDRMRCKLDYSLPLATIYARTALHIIHTARKLTILSHKTATNKNLPSWVPDWSSGRSTVSTERKTTPLPPDLYSASRNSAASTLHPPSLTLTLRGFRITPITHISGPLMTNGIYPVLSLPHFASLVDSLEQMMSKACEDNCSSDDQGEKLATDQDFRWKVQRHFRNFPDPRVSDSSWRTLVRDTHLACVSKWFSTPAPSYWSELFELVRNASYADGPGDASFEHRHQQFEDYSKLIPHAPRLETPSPLRIPDDFQPELPLAERISSFAKPLLSQMAATIQGRYFFVMESGHIGLTAR